MHGRKRYWTEAFVATILISMIFGFVAGSKYRAEPTTVVQVPLSDAEFVTQPERVASSYKSLSGCSCFCFENTNVPMSNPLIQPGARCISSYRPPTAGMAVQGGNLKMEGVPGASDSMRDKYKHSQRWDRFIVGNSCHGILDVTPMAITLPLLVIGSLIALRKKLF